VAIRIFFIAYTPNEFRRNLLIPVFTIPESARNTVARQHHSFGIDAVWIAAAATATGIAFVRLRFLFAESIVGGLVRGGGYERHTLIPLLAKRQTMSPTAHPAALKTSRERQIFA
jgi:hypothetical protein